MAKHRNRLYYLLLTGIVITLGLSSRYFARYLLAVINLYLGDVLWSLMVFLFLGFIFHRKPTLWIASVAIVFSFSIELSQLYQEPWLNKIRQTTLGGLVLGYGFLWTDLLAYLMGIIVGVSLDERINQKQ